MHRGWRYRLRVNKAEIRFLLDSLSPGETAVDAGAYRGAFTYWMCKRVGESGAVVAFEPQDGLSQYLRTIQSRFPLPQLRVVQAALSSKPGQATLNIPVHLGQSSLLPTEDACETIVVPKESLDHYCARHKLGPVKFIKADVEGSELEMLHGAERILREDRPCMLIECVDRYHGTVDLQAVLAFIRDLDYDGFFFPQDQLRPLSEFRVDYHQWKPFSDRWNIDFAFVPKECSASIRLGRAA
jgi:FkbM family methyltransferase